MALLSIQQISKAFGGPRLLDQATLQIERNERIFMVGRNGEGKSTLLKIIAGELEPDTGSLIPQPGLKIRALQQNVPDQKQGTIEDLVRSDFTENEESWETQQAIDRTISIVGLENHLHFHQLSGGQKRRALLAKALVCEPDLLILDEPTNHLDIESIQWLEQFLLRYRGSLIVVTHDRTFLRKLATRIIELDRGNLHSWACDYETYLKRKQALLDGEAEQWAQFDKKLAQEELWIRKGIKARRTRNEGRVRALEQMRLERQHRRERSGTAQLNLNEAELSGRKVAAINNLSYAYENLPIVTHFHTDIMRGDKIGIIGPNGCGKSTLIQLLLGQLEPQQGTVKHGTKLEVAYFDQHRATIDDQKTVAENVSTEESITINGRSKHVLGYLQDFLFAPDRARQKARVLSGGERNRLLLAKLFTQPANVLVLDEPTNDLDVETLELLEELLVQYDGTLLLVSHDRTFLNNVVSSTIVFEGNGVLKTYVGGYDDWLDQRIKPEPIRPKQTPSSPAQKTNKRKLSNRERDELKTLPATIEKLETEFEQLQIQMSDPAFYRQKKEEISAANQRAESLPQELEKAYQRWEELDAIQ
jgi:ATP-binding cassette subfamily F protein uup